MVVKFYLKNITTVLVVSIDFYEISEEINISMAIEGMS
jgi:hypothetical protein